MVGFWDLVGTGIAPVSKKTAVNKKLLFINRAKIITANSFLLNKGFLDQSECSQVEASVQVLFSEQELGYFHILTDYYGEKISYKQF